jgi:aryl-alcohol dehydrogenase-like predicted oxidoreductase
MHPRFQGENFSRNREIVDRLEGIAGDMDVSPAQLALAWVLAQRPWMAPIPGTTKLARLQENLGAADIELTAEDLGEIAGAAAEITVQGARYPEHIEKMTGL